VCNGSGSSRQRVLGRFGARRSHRAIPARLQARRRQVTAMRAASLLIVLTLSGAVAYAQTRSRSWMPAAADVDGIYQDLDALSVDLHRNPELGFQESQPAAKFAARVRALGFDVTTGVGGTGIVAIMKNGPGPTVMLRTELDALPVEEKTGLPFASRVVVTN